MHIHIFGRKIKVKKVKNLSHTTGKMGYYDDIRGEIVICSELGEKDATLTYYHEIAHAFIFRLGWSQVLGRQAQEIFCEQFSFFMWDLFHQ